MHDMQSPIAVVAYDAGAANLIIAWLKAWGKPVRAYMQGPAARLWEAAFPSELLCISLGDALEGASSLVSGTGWASSLEHDARVRARQLGLHSVAVLDHWVNYPMRFVRRDRAQLPDELWVADEWAFQIALKEFPLIPVRCFDNLYLKAQVDKIRPAPGVGTVLYVLEPVRQTWGRDQEGEFQALDFALERIDELCRQRVSTIILRPHPSEMSNKYARYLAADPRIRIDFTENIAQAISIADVVIGVESFALIVALEAGRPVYSSLPPWAGKIRLPVLGITEIRNLESK
jgi:hypothetical protein